MGVRFHWSNSSHVVMHCFIEYPWTWEEYQTAINQITREVLNESHPVGVVMEVSHMKAFPEEGNAVTNLQRSEAILPDNVFGSVLVGAAYHAAKFMNVLTQMNPRSRRATLYAGNIEEGHHVLEKYHVALIREGSLEALMV